MVGDSDTSPVSESMRRVVTYFTRPVARSGFLLAIALALAEGRPARRSPRRSVARLQARVDGVPAKLLDVSYEGIRLELPAQHRSSLPPFFSVTVPMFNTSVVGQRVWINSVVQRDDERSFCCGVRLGRNPDHAAAAWQALVDNAPASTSMQSEALNYL
jgi:hypothetical protein